MISRTFISKAEKKEHPKKGVLLFDNLADKNGKIPDKNLNTIDQ